MATLRKQPLLFYTVDDVVSEPAVFSDNSGVAGNFVPNDLRRLAKRAAALFAAYNKSEKQIKCASAIQYKCVFLFSD